MKFTIRDLPNSERPRERLEQLGSSSLSLQELFEILLGQGGKKSNVSRISHDLISKHGNLQRINDASIKELCNVSGVGYAKASQIKAAFELGKRVYLENDFKTEQILTSLDAYKIANYYLKDKKKEYLMLFCLDVQGKLIKRPEVLSIGILDCSLVHPREIFNVAIANNSSKVMLAHNHPSGNSVPSGQDIEVTKQVFAASKIIGIELVDHIVIGKNEYSSIREQKPYVFELNDNALFKNAF